MSNPTNPYWDRGSDEEAEENVTDIEWASRDGIIFLIDATESMFIKEGISDSYFQTVLKCCHMTMLKKVHASVKDLIGVVLFGTDKKENSLNANNLIILQKLEQPSIEKIKSLDAMIKSDSYDNFEEKHGHSNDYILQDALWLCQFMFSECSQKMGMRRILLFTANDKPHADNRIEQQRALDRANDLKGLNISLELFPLGPNFNAALIFKDLVEAAMGDDYTGQMLPISSLKLEEFLKRTCCYSHKKRSQGRILLYLGPDVAIGVGIYSMFSKTSVPKRVWLERTTNLPVQPVTYDFNADTGEKVLSIDIMKSKIVGGEKVFFKPQETKDTKTLLDVGFHLMGFKPQDRIKLQYHFKKPYFLFPDERQVKGSRKLFAALLKQCVVRNKVALCWGVLRKNSSPQLYALFPQPEVVNPSTGMQEIAGGFHSYCLPFSENISVLSFEKMVPASPEQVDAMKNIVSKLTSHYDVHDFQNPKLQTLWAGIEALALGLESARRIQDSTKPKNEEIKNKISELGLDFDEMFHCEAKNIEGIKRPAGLKKETAPKRLKLEKTDPDLEEMVVDYAKQEKVEKLKVDQLKAFLMSKGERVTGVRKAELINMVYRIFKSD